ncbi:hypothetical protein SEUCBS140593_008069 [Sporothrix eucalyptigena]|uniref:Uncharacterized protein n=1 Tax=Sporothrix eucalyptigena TaxID=1812306 RepID=A0ABP0CIF5_9PEZI
MKSDSIFSVVLESYNDIWCIKDVLKAEDKIQVEDGKPLVVTKFTFSPATSMLTVLLPGSSSIIMRDAGLSDEE